MSTAGIGDKKIRDPLRIAIDKGVGGYPVITKHRPYEPPSPPAFLSPPFRLLTASIHVRRPRVALHNVTAPEITESDR